MAHDASCPICAARRDDAATWTATRSASQLRASFATRHIPIVMLTARAELADKVRGLEGGANDYVTKPWDSAS